MSKILIAEDSSTQRELVATLLKKFGLDVIVAVHGLEAVEKAKSHLPDLVILDIIMPHMNGYEVCRELKAKSETANIPIVMCSSKSEEFDQYWGMKQGADAYISKPFRPEDLLGTVKQLLRR